MENYHIPALLKETIEYLNIHTKELYIDATLGGGGHTLEILKNGGRVLSIDTDDEALEHGKEKFNGINSPFKIGVDIYLAKGNFRDIAQIAHLHSFENVSGILFDFGVSSHQLDTPQRGFSFMKDAPLDMRMCKDLGVTAADLINALGYKELYDLFTKYGEEKNAYILAKNIVSKRLERPFKTTVQLAEFIDKTVGRREKIHPATRVFQALRIAVNDELGSIEEALPRAFSLLKKGGRIVTISFHSLEDGIVKNTFKSFEERGIGKIITEKPVVPTEEEIEKNNRVRSSKLRVIEKI